MSHNFFLKTSWNASYNLSTLFWGKKISLSLHNPRLVMIFVFVGVFYYLKEQLLWRGPHLFIIVGSKIPVPKLTHTRHHTGIFIQANLNFRCHNLYSWKAFTHHMYALRCLRWGRKWHFHKKIEKTGSSVEMNFIKTLCKLTDMRLRNIILGSGTPLLMSKEIACTAEFPEEMSRLSDLRMRYIIKY